MPERFTYSFKTALALVMAYGLSLWFEWPKSMWAAFAVALISLPTLEASLGKGGQRLWGTLLATFVALLLIALFPQQRWWFMAFQAGWLAFCTYRMSAPGYAYLWFCAGFVTSIITANGGPDPVNAFSTAMVRTLETCLGIICYALVFALLWPARSTSENDSTPPTSVPSREERMNAAAQVFIAYCLGFLLVVLVPGFPGGFGFLGMLAPFALVLATTPKMAVGSLVLPVCLSILFATPIYMFLMPLLSGFEQLAVVIFLACFAICYVLHKPGQALGRTFGLAFFAVVTSISNDQNYSFIALANVVLMFGLVLLVLYFSTSLHMIKTDEGGMLAKDMEST